MSSYTFPLATGVEKSRVSFAFKKTYSSTHLAGTKHKGVDLVAKDGSRPTILATIGGTVTEQGYNQGGYGNYCVIHGADGFYHIYAHMQSPANVRKGDTAQAGQSLGILGSTGNVTGPHLHYEVRQKRNDANTLINPCELIGIANSEGLVKATDSGIVSVQSVSPTGSGMPAVPPNTPYEEMSPIIGSEEKGDILFGRKCRVFVSDDTGKGVEMTNLHIVFNVQKTYLQDLQYSIIQVYNVNRDTESFILRKGTTVIIEAGYEGSNYGEIFQGDIIQAMGYRENGTDFVLKIVAADSDRFLNEGFVSNNIERGMTQRQAAESLATKATVPTKINTISADLNKNTLPRGKVFFGMAKDYLGQIAKTSNATLYMNNGQVNILKVGDPPDGSIIKLTPASGLIGQVQQTELGIKGKALLIPQIRVNKSIQVENQYIQERQLAMGSLQTLLDAQGVYRIAKTTYSGDNRGNDWYVEFEAMTQAGYLPTLLQNEAGNPF